MGAMLCARHLDAAPCSRKSVGQLPDALVRKSIRIHGTDMESALQEAAAGVAGGGSSLLDCQYNAVISEARSLVGHGGVQGTFPEEWDAQLLVDCGRSSAGHRVVIFCPAFLKPHLDDPEELDRAFRFVLFTMDKIAMREKYVFIYCFLGMDWSSPELASRLRLAYDILPRRYAKNLRRLYVLHATQSFRLTMWTFWAWVSKRTWDKIEYVDSLSALCQLLQPEDEPAQEELRRHFPQAVQRNDASLAGESPPVSFGVPLQQLCSTFGVDFTDKTTGRWYSRLPPQLVFLCEAMEREAAEESFGDMFSADASIVYDLVDKVDSGEPVPPDIPTAALWCVLKLYLDCLPCPLLTFSALEELQQQGVRKDDAEGKRRFLVALFQQRLPNEAAFVALYTASFLRLMCQNAQDRLAARRDVDEGGRSSGEAAPAEGQGGGALTPALAASVFASSFFRPRAVAPEHLEAMDVAVAVVETLIECAEEPDLWVGRHQTAPTWDKATSDSDDSAEDE